MRWKSLTRTGSRGPRPARRSTSRRRREATADRASDLARRPKRFAVRTTATLACVLASGCALEAPRSDLPTSIDPPAPVAETELFRFHVDDRSTLLYVLDLIAWRGHPELQRPSLPELFERIPLDARDRWSRAVDTFRAQASGRDPTLDPGLLAVRDYLRGAISIDGIQDGDRALISALEDVLPSYQDTWWPVHRAAARAWVDSVVQVLPGLEVRTATAIATAMRGPWPDRPIDVFVVYYAPRTGGYATGEPVVTIAIADAVSWLSDGLEPLFHHAAHAFVLVKSLRVTIERAFGAAGRQAPDRLWHTILFLTVEEAVAAARAEAGLPPAIPLGQALPYYTRDADYQRDFRAADLYWRPFLRGVTELTDALRGLIHDY